MRRLVFMAAVAALLLGEQPEKQTNRSLYAFPGKGGGWVGGREKGEWDEEKQW